MKSICLALASLIPFFLQAQTIQPLELTTRYYKELQLLSSEPDPDQVDLDQKRYPSSERATGKQFIGLQPSYLKDGDVNDLVRSIAFPANSSQQTRAELDYLLAWEERRKGSDRSRAFEIARVGYWPPLKKDATSYGNVDDLFWECQEVMGSACTADRYPATKHVLAGVIRDARILEFTAKYHHRRARPYHLEPKLNPLGRVPNPSFASGHTLWAYAQAFVYSELIPAKRQSFLDVAFEVGQSREIMGIHYPSDEEAARVLAHRMLTKMAENKEFLEDLRRAKEEWK